MVFLGLSIAEWAAVASVLSLCYAGAIRLYHQFRTTISAPLIDAIDKLRVEISQLEGHWVKEYQDVKQQTEQLDVRLRSQEQRLGKKERGYDDYRVADGG